MDVPPEFLPWPKIPRLNRSMIVTEKIDGSNAAIVVTEDGQVYAQSRKRFVTPSQDNFGFGQFVWERAEEFAEFFGPGHHFGEWYGAGIQRRYGLDEKRFMLFNVGRWGDVDLPDRIEVATVLYHGDFSVSVVNDLVDDLRREGSAHVPGFMNPEGVIAYHQQGNLSFKVTCLKDAEPKALAAERRAAA
jgi:hypothetical protein